MALINTFSSSSLYSYEEYKETANWLQGQTMLRPKVAIICGSGLGGLVDLMDDRTEFAYKDIPHFPTSTGRLFVTVAFLQANILQVFGQL